MGLQCFTVSLVAYIIAYAQDLKDSIILSCISHLQVPSYVLNETKRYTKETRGKRTSKHFLYIFAPLIKTKKEVMTEVLIFSQFDETPAICKILNWPLKYKLNSYSPN